MKAKFNIVDDQGNDVEAPKPACVAADEFVKHPYASLPVDQDCNGIADSWEQNHGGPFPDPTADVDPGALGSGTPDAYKGDGFAVFDEYRGFHMLDDQGNTVWHDTDPNVQDLFYWDPNGLTAGASVNHLSDIFGRETDSFIALHAVNAEQAHGHPDDLTAHLQPLNANSPFKNSGGPVGFAIVYRNDSLPGSELGNSGPDGDPDSLRKAGVFPITIDLAKITSDAALLRTGDPAPYAATLLEETLAHETGHKLGRTHRERVAGNVTFDKKGINTSLQLGQFMQQPDKLNLLFVEEVVYALTQAAGFATNQIKADERVRRGAFVGSGGVMTSYSLTVDRQSPFKGPAQPPQWPFKVTTEQNHVLDQVTILRQDGTMMCWTPELDKQQPADWHFAPDDLDALCLLASACPAGN
ncbi:MAG TPA: hypothetical protein VN893_07545 [Bryobacteraceae bacterium]|nr:hypothetical protein [Bryobacteraceae bacterium]